MTYSRPGTGQVDAFGEIANPMAITRSGLRAKSTVSAKGAYLDNRDPAQAGRNEKAKTAGVENFLKFLVEDIAPIAKGELEAKGKAAAMDAVTSIPGMADGSFYRQSDVEQRKVLKDYSINGYALDQLKSYGAGSAVGRYGERLADDFAGSPILQSNAPQAERDAEKQRIFSENRTILQGIEPGYLAQFAPQLSRLEGQLVGKSESMARDARNLQLKNTAIESSSGFWKETAGEMIGNSDASREDKIRLFEEGAIARLRQDRLKSLPTMTDEEWVKTKFQGMLKSLNEAIADESPEEAQAILDAWEGATGTPLRTENGYDVWDYLNNAEENGRTPSERLVAYAKTIDRLDDERRGEIAITGSAADIAAAIGGDQAALDRVNQTIMKLYADGNIKGAEALSAQITQEVRNSESRFKDNIVELGRLAALKLDPRTKPGEYSLEVQGSVNARLISSGTGRSLVSSFYRPSENERATDAAITRQEEIVVGGINVDTSTGAKQYVPGEDADVNNAVASGKAVSSLVSTRIDDYMTGLFWGELDVAIKGQFKDGEPIPTGADLRQIIKDQSIRLIKEKTAALEAEISKTRKGKIAKSNSIKQPVYEAIEEGLTPDKIWGESIINESKESKKRPYEIWKARYAQSLIGLDNADTPNPDRKGEFLPYDLESATKEAQAELNRIRKKISNREGNQSRPGSKGVPISSFAVPQSTEVAYDTALPGFEEVVAVAAKNPDQDGDQGLLAVGGTNILNALGRVLPGGGSPASAATASSELGKAQTIQAVENSNGWKTLNRIFARRERVSATTQPLPQLPPTALTDTVSIAMTSDRHPMMVHIGIAEGTRTINGGYTRAYRGHADPGDGHRNRGTVSGGRGMGNATPQQVDRYWMRELTARSARIAPAMARAGLRPGTVGYNRFMFNYLDLSVQSPQASIGFAAKLSSMKAGNWSIEAMAKARADSFYNPMTGRLEASGFNNNYSRLLGDQRSRAGVWDYKRRI